MLCSANSKPGLSRLLGFRHPTLRKRGPETTSQRNQERNQEALRSESFVAFVGCKLQQPWLDASENLHSSKEKYFKASLVGGNIFFLTCPLVWPPPSYFEPLKGHFPQALGPISKCLARDTARPAHGAVASSMGESTPEVEGRSWGFPGRLHSWSVLQTYTHFGHPHLEKDPTRFWGPSSGTLLF